VSRLRLQVVTAAIFLLAWTQSSALERKHESGILPIDPPTPYIRYFGHDSPIARVLVVHGLDVSKEVMRPISAALADGGFEVYAIDLPGHGDSPAPFRTDLAQQAIRNAKTHLGDETIVLGHSMGAGLLLDLAATERFSTMVLLSPPPLSVGEIHADRVLIATGDIDIPRIRNFVAIAADIGNPKVEAWTLPWGGHSAPIFNPEYVRRVVQWLGGNGGATRTASQFVWIALMLASAVTFGVLLLPGQKLQPSESHIAPIIVRYVAAASLALVVLKIINPLRWLRLFATDYLISFVLVTGLALLAAVSKTIKTQRYKRGMVTAIMAAAFVIAVPGFVIFSRVMHISLSDGRWWRFPCIALAGLPLFISDEWTIRRIHPRWKSDAVALLTRGLFLAFLLTGVLTFDRESAFIVLIVPLIVIFWIALWFATGVVHRHTQSPFAAALFASIVQGWAFAAWFVTI